MRKWLSREWHRDDYWLLVICPTFKLGVCRSVLSRMMANERIKTVSADLSLETRAGLQWQYLSEKTSTNLSIFWASPGIRKWVWNFLKATSTYFKQLYMKRRLFSNKVGTINPKYTAFENSGSTSFEALSSLKNELWPTRFVGALRAPPRSLRLPRTRYILL